MAEQTELDLPAAPASAGAVAPTARKAAFAGFSRRQILAGAALFAAIIWGMWVTRALTSAEEEPLVAARLSALVGDYVEAQRFSGSPPDRVQAEMRAFMASLDKELQRRSASGQVVLVGEAVLTKNVPDITDSLKAAVFASGVPVPKRASVEELQRMQELAAAQAALAARPAQPGSIDPIGAAQQLVPPAAPVPSAMPEPRGQAGQGATVSTFGGPDGSPRP